MRLDGGEQVEPFLAGGGVARVVQIDEGGVEFSLLDRGEHGLGRCGELELIALGLKQKAQGFQHILLVVRDQDAVASFSMFPFEDIACEGSTAAMSAPRRATVHSVM